MGRIIKYLRLRRVGTALQPLRDCAFVSLTKWTRFDLDLVLNSRLSWIAASFGEGRKLFKKITFGVLVYQKKKTLNTLLNMPSYTITTLESR